MPVRKNSVRVFNFYAKENIMTKQTEMIPLATAAELLRATNLSVGEVAWQVGLHDVSYFTGLFKRQWGQTPARYRLSVRGKLFNPRP